MEISQIKLAELLAVSFLVGVAMGIINDINRIVRNIFNFKFKSNRFKGLYTFLKITEHTNKRPTKFNSIIFKVMFFVQDLVFTSLFALSIVLLNYYYNDGKMRLFSVGSLILGFITHFCTFGKITMFVLEPLTIIIKELFKRLLHLCLQPFIFIIHKAISFSKNIFLVIKKHIEIKTNLRYNIKERKRMIILSKTGFINCTELNNER